MANLPRLDARGVSKTFGPNTVLHDAGLVVQPGEIHALVGQNGSGKSTLVKILTGYHGADTGARIDVDGKPLSLPVHWSAAQAAGVSVVHQDLGLLDDLSVAENIGVGGFRRSRVLRRIDWKAHDRIAEAVLTRLEIPVSPRDKVGSLPASHRAAVAIARALRDAVPGEGLMILDEATRSLPREELAHFHRLLRRVVYSGASVLMVSHNLEEVLALSDRVTVLRDGAVAGAGLETASLTEADLARLMLGKTADVVTKGDSRATGAVAARIEGLVLDGHEPLSISVRAGEVVGVTGLPGTGFEQMPAFVSGAARPRGGMIATDAGRVDLTTCHVDQCLAAGIAMVPERRDRDGLAADLSIRDNLALPNVHRKGKPWFVSRAWQDTLTDEAIRRLDIKTRGGADLVKELSGGNQQKVLFAKWLSVAPVLLVLHEPTQAVDVGARADLLMTVRTIAESGTGVLLVSTEPSDLVETCDRVLVLHPGRAPQELRTNDPDDVLDAIYAEPLTTGAPHA